MLQIPADDATGLKLQYGLSFLLFLQHSRCVLRQVMVKFGISLSLLEPIFNHTVVHSADHIAYYNAVKDCRFGPDPFCTVPATDWKVFRAHMFLTMFARPTVNPLFPNTLQTSRSQFCQDFYHGLAEFDDNWAKHISCSIMY